METYFFRGGWGEAAYSTRYTLYQHCFLYFFFKCDFLSLRSLPESEPLGPGAPGDA